MWPRPDYPSGAKRKGGAQEKQLQRHDSPIQSHSTSRRPEARVGSKLEPY